MFWIWSPVCLKKVEYPYRTTRPSNEKRGMFACLPKKKVQNLYRTTCLFNEKKWICLPVCQKKVKCIFRTRRPSAENCLNVCLFLFNQRRWDYEGCFDVLVVAHGEKSTKPIVILGDTLSIHGEYDVPCSASHASYRPHVAL